MCQEHFAKLVLQLGTPTVLVLTNGGPLAIDDIIDDADAIVEAFNPGFGAKQLAEALFGLTNCWVSLRLVATILFSFSDYYFCRPAGEVALHNV